MKIFFRIIFLALVLYGGSYMVFRSANTEISAKDHKSYVIYPAEDYVYQLFRPAAYADESLTGTGSHIGSLGTARTVFQETGVLERDNFGLKPGTWYLMYQNPGSSALTIELVFAGGVNTGGLFVGDRVVVTGTKQNDKVVVSKITKEKLY